jgi:hypothetical protein
MLEGKFDEKIYKSMRYVGCYCGKHAKVLVGAKIQGYMNVGLGVPIAVFFFFFILLLDISLLIKAGILIPLSLLCILLPRSLYKDGRKMMLENGHTEFCARKIGRLVMVHGGIYSPFTIMKNDKVVKKADTK